MRSTASRQRHKKCVNMRRGTPLRYLVVAVDEVGDALDHAVLLVVRDLRHQAEVQDHQLAVRGTEHVARVRV